MNPAFISLAIFSSLALAASGAVIKWVPAGSKNCSRTCERISMIPVASGTYIRHNKDYWVCAANAGDQGFRTGYNLPSHSRGCIVGYDGREVVKEVKKCLCADQDLDSLDLVWSEADDGQSCNQTCTTEGFGMKPVPSGVYAPQKLPYYVCSSNYAMEGFRPGYQIPGFADNDCVVGWGQNEERSEDFGKKCLCYQSNEILSLF